jgi:hypothetical protein
MRFFPQHTAAALLLATAVPGSAWAGAAFNFQVVEDCLARRFPIYKPGDSNAKASGGLRQICYKLRAAEAGWLLRPTSVLKF